MAEPQASSVEKRSLSPAVLIAAGLAVLDGVLALLFLALWAAQPDHLLSTLQSMAGICLLLGLAPILVGGWLLDRNRRKPGGVPGIVWARWAVLAGGVLTSVTLLIPMMAALSAITGGS